MEPFPAVVIGLDGRWSLIRGSGVLNEINLGISEATGLPAPELPSFDQEGSFNEVNIEVTARYSRVSGDSLDPPYAAANL